MSMTSHLSALALATALAIATGADAAERLVLPPYPAERPWQQVTNKAAGVQFLWEYIPAGQRLGGYTDFLGAQAFPRAPGLDASGLIRRVFSNVAAACDGARVNGPKTGVEGGYPVAYGQVYCGQEKGKPTGADIFYKVIQGSEALYMVHREFRTPPSTTGGVHPFPKGSEAAAKAFMDARAQANAYLANSVYLCGDRGPDPRCRGR
jgi:hypothetical protein